MQLPGLSPKQDAALSRLGYHTVAQLRKRLKKCGREDAIIAKLPAAAVAELAHSPTKAVPLARAKKVAAKLQQCLKIQGSRLSLKKRLVVVGSIRRGKAFTKDIDLLLVLPDRYRTPAGRNRIGLEKLVVDSACGCGKSLQILESYANGEHRRSFLVRAAGPPHNGKATKANYQVDIFLTYASAKPYAMYHYTGSGRYNIRIRTYAKRKGWLLNQYGLFDRKTGRPVRGTSKIKTEQDLAAFLGVSWREPSNRVR